MELEIKILDSKVVKQAVRDVASKHPELSDKALHYFSSQDFKDLCLRNKIDAEVIARSIKELMGFPLLSRKKLANDIAQVLDREFF